MVEQSRRDRVGLGLIGLGPSWDQHYREALVRLDRRLKIRFVYDPVQARAKSVATEFDATVAGSVRQLLLGQSLQGLLLLDPGSYAGGLLQLLTQCDLPVFVAQPLLRHQPALRDLLRMTTAAAGHKSLTGDEQFMPELSWRFTPTTCRLRELMATKLGPAKQIMIKCDLSANSEELTKRIDWCLNIIGQESPLAVHPTKEFGELQRLELHFPVTSVADAGRSDATRTVLLQQQAAEADGARTEIECARGRAVILNRTQIHWTTDLDAADESLMNERTETEILIDQFCRRALGGLNPIGRMSEYVRAIDLLEAAAQ